MGIASSRPSAGTMRHGYHVTAWLVGLIVYLLCLLWSSDATEQWVNNGAWTIAASVAAWGCLRTARRLDSDGRGWWLLGLGCVSWLIGQIIWNYDQLVRDIELPVLGIGPLFYWLFSVLVLAAISQLREKHQNAPFVSTRVGNLALVLCCLATAVVLGLIEPLLHSSLPANVLWMSVFRGVTIATTFLFALYCLWTYRWVNTWGVMVKLVVATGVHSVSAFVFMRSLALQTYLPDDAVNASWLVVFGLISWAAAQRAWLHSHPAVAAPRLLQQRERWLEAVVPALLIVVMVAVGVANVGMLTPRVLLWTALLSILFATILGVREAMVQSDAQRLNNELLDANRRLNEANAELRDSELRYRDLNAVLEKRVTERTAELQRAYGELEAFSYAVAHDLKAPLRAIDGFAHLLREELGPDVSAEAEACLKRIRGGAIKMASLIDDLLSYANIERRELHAAHLGLQMLVRTAVDEFTHDIEHRKVQLTLDVQPLTLFVDADGLALVLRNLLGNALKYSSEVTAPAIDIRAQRTDNGVLLTVRDNGIGFDMQYHDRIFNVFQRLHREEQYPGTGIGLALVRKAVERMGGRVWAQSAPGEGATFSVALPKAAVA